MQRFDDKHSIPAPYTLPDHRALQALMDMTESGEVDYSKFCEAAIDQPVITMQIMRAARAIRAGRENGVEELRHAIAIIGMRRVHDIIEKTRSQVAQVQSVVD